MARKKVVGRKVGRKGKRRNKKRIFGVIKIWCGVCGTEFIEIHRVCKYFLRYLKYKNTRTVIGGGIYDG